MENKQTPPTATDSAIQQRSTARTWFERAAVIVIGLALFGFGVLVGNGRIEFAAHPVSKNTSLPDQLDYSTVNDVYQKLKDNYNGKLTESQLLDGLKHGLAEATNDPYTEYFTPKEAKQFTEQVNDSIEGIGAPLDIDKDKQLIISAAPITSTPAEKAGLKSQDKIITINGKSTVGMSLDDAVLKIRGPKGTNVKLGIIRGNQQLTFTITRAVIQIPSVTTKTLDGNIGYMAINAFSSDTASLSQKAADTFVKQGVKGIVVDLRDNPGGYVDAAVSVSSLWVPKGSLVVNEKGTIGEAPQLALGGNELANIPSVVLVNGGTASASEITASALHDNHKATIIGEKSFGKGVMQQPISFKDGSLLKVTIASWYRPNGQNINHKGITPDQVVKLSDDDIKAGNDTQLKAAQAYLVTKH
jgi:carboxyl-terminal processing protease